MPLKKGRSQNTVGSNIEKNFVHEYEDTGRIGTSHPASKKKAVKQAVAIALHEGGTQPQAAGGSKSAHPSSTPESAPNSTQRKMPDDRMHFAPPPRPRRCPRPLVEDRPRRGPAGRRSSRTGRARSPTRRRWPGPDPDRVDRRDDTRGRRVDGDGRRRRGSGRRARACPSPGRSCWRAA